MSAAKEGEKKMTMKQVQRFLGMNPGYILFKMQLDKASGAYSYLEALEGECHSALEESLTHGAPRDPKDSLPPKLEDAMTRLTNYLWHNGYTCAEFPEYRNGIGIQE